MGIYRDNIKNNIIKYRKLMGLKQSDLAEMLNIAPTSVSSWERGANAPDIETLINICKIFKISLSEMYGSDDVSLSHDEVLLIDKYRQLDDISRDIIHYVIDAELKRENNNPISLAARGGSSESNKIIINEDKYLNDLKKPMSKDFDYWFPYNNFLAFILLVHVSISFFTILVRKERYYV